MQGVLKFHKENLQKHGRVNEAWEEAFRSDNELRETRQTLSRIVHGLPKAAQLHASVKDNTASSAAEDGYYDKPIQDLLGATELRDLSLGASEVKEDFSLLEGLASHVDGVHLDPSGGAEDKIPHDMLAAEAYGVEGEEDAQVSGYHEEYSTAPLEEQLLQLKAQSVGAGDPPPPIALPALNRDSKPDDTATSFRKFKTPPPLTEGDDFKLGSERSEGAYSARAINGGRQGDHFAAPRRRVYEDHPWPEPLPASVFAERPREIPVETPKPLKKQESDEEQAVIRTLKKRLSSFLGGTNA
jgi:hypothetical protein